ncbi:hypothetical protein Taro_007744 [Colocasia esculenta]|uniref:Aminotransferase-like plant mobile domain-containing protein n=1 Tax=Colocasia esculenta TaxID=4460 RepID=A0A843U1B2_COLES|nr:hypothetical protein [Colocasia esculenta]
MRARVSWTLVLAAFLALPPFQRERVDEMGFGQVFRIERMRVDPALTQALRSRWDTEASAFAFPWGHMIPSLEDVSRITGLRVYGRAVSGYTYSCYHDLAERLLDLPVERRSSLVPRVALQESLGLFEAGKNAGETEDEYLERLARVSRRELASEPGLQADLDLRRFLVLFLGRLLFATRGDAVHCRFLPLLEDLGEVGGYAWGAAFLAHQFDGLSASEWQTSTSGFYPFLQVWAYLHLPALRRGELTRPGLVPIARGWDSRRDTRHLADQLEHLQEALDSYPYLDVVWQPYLGEGDEGQPWLPSSSPSSVDISSKFRTTASLTNSLTARRAPHLWTKSKRYLWGTPLPFFFLDEDGDSLETTPELELDLIFTGGSGDASRDLLEGKAPGAAGPRRSSDGVGGGSGPPELRVPASASGCRGAEGPSPELPEMVMADHQASEKDDGGYWGAGATGIAVESGSRRGGVTGIAVEIGSAREVTGTAVEIRSWKGVTGIAVGIRSWKGVTGIAVEIGSAREAMGIAVEMRSTRG